MLAFLLEIKQWLATGKVYPFAVFMTAVWLLWLLRVGLSRSYRPWRRRVLLSASVIIPVVDESPALFAEVLARIVRQHPHEVIVVINGPRNETLEAVCRTAGVYWRWTETPGKRNAVRMGVEVATGDVCVLVDSDTLWTSNTLVELLKPFRDPEVGGVTTQQRIYSPERCLLTRWADWLESIRSHYSMPAMSVLGTVGCLPGRTIAFRTSVLRESMAAFMTERFLGVHLEVSDDRSLTNLALRAGWRTVYQSTSLVYTDAPTTLSKLARQQLRWARGSQYNTLRMLPWMLRHSPILAVMYLSDIAIPFVLTGAVVSWMQAVVTQDSEPIYSLLPLPDSRWLAVPSVVALAVLMTGVSLAIRFGRHFTRHPAGLAYLPIFMLINTFLLLPARMFGFVRLAHDSGWGTRAGGYSGARAWNPWAAIPYVMGGLMLVASVAIGG